MSRRYCDLHLHSTASDGADGPGVVAGRAAALGIGAIALTDHDTVAGIAEAQTAAAIHGVAYLPAVEITARHGRHEVHVLGYGIDPAAPALAALLETGSALRDRRIRTMIAKLNELGVPVDAEAVFELSGGGSVGRMHLARVVHEMGHAPTVQGVFDKYIGAGKRAYAPRTAVAVAEAIDAIHGAGGLAFLAHPGIGKTRHVLPALLALPFDGIEAYHARHSPGQTEGFIALANERGLMVSGGSDCHGAAKFEPTMGKVQVPFARYEAIRDRLEALRAAT